MVVDLIRRTYKTGLKIEEGLETWQQTIVITRYYSSLKKVDFDAEILRKNMSWWNVNHRLYFNYLYQSIGKFINFKQIMCNTYKKNTIVAYYMVLEINARDESLILLKDSILYISKLFLTSSFLNILKCFFLHF